MSDGEPTQQQKDAAATQVEEAIKRFQDERDAKPNALKPAPVEEAKP